MQALTSVRSRANRSASRLMPSRGWVGISKAFNPRVSRAWSESMQMGDSRATVSPGRQTARRHRAMASVVPKVVTRSAAARRQPDEAASRAT